MRLFYGRVDSGICTKAVAIYYLLEALRILRISHDL